VKVVPSLSGSIAERVRSHILGDLVDAQAAGPLRPIAGKDVECSPAEQHLEGPAHLFRHHLVHEVVPIRHGPAAKSEAAAGIFGGESVRAAGGFRISEHGEHPFFFKRR